MSGYTKGPWIANEFYIYDDKQRDALADCCYRDYDTNRANAKLIAAAPDLLEALQKIKFRCECFLEDDRDMKKHSIEAIKAICDAVIDKALAQKS